MTMRRFKGSKARVCVAVNFDEPSRRAVKVAEQYCHRTGAEMHLVHICENLLTSNMAIIASSSLVPIPSEVLQTAQENTLKEAERKIFEMSALVKAPITVTTSISNGIPGTPADLIEAEALSTHSSLIVVGANPGSHRFVPKGFSCALSLMSNSTLPVMVVKSNHTLDFNEDRLKMVIADDLKSPSISAVRGGCELAFALGKTDIHHIHVTSFTLDTLEVALNSALAASYASLNQALSASEIYDMAIKQLESKLESRTSSMNISLEMTACKYHRSLQTDNSVTHCIEKYTAQTKANLIVLGRHQTFQRKPFSIGQMPFYAMLNLTCPVIVFPQDDF